jgi:hypothetical protein
MRRKMMKKKAKKKMIHLRSDLSVYWSLAEPPAEYNRIRFKYVHGDMRTGKLRKSKNMTSIEL